MACPPKSVAIFLDAKRRHAFRAVQKEPTSAAVPVVRGRNALRQLGGPRKPGRGPEIAAAPVKFGGPSIGWTDIGSALATPEPCAVFHERNVRRGRARLSLSTGFALGSGATGDRDDPPCPFYFLLARRRRSCARLCNCPCADAEERRADAGG